MSIGSELAESTTLAELLCWTLGSDTRLSDIFGFVVSSSEASFDQDHSADPIIEIPIFIVCDTTLPVLSTSWLLA